MTSPLFSPAAERNKQPILEVLQAVLPARGTALEIASGTGQHAVWFAAALPGWNWQPTEADDAALDALASVVTEARLPNLHAPRRLDVTSPQWPSDGAAFVQLFDAIFCANMLHIAPWSCCAGLMQGSARLLAADGRLITYGPYLEDHVDTAAGNLAFDASLRARDASWGLRRLKAVHAEAARHGLALRARHAMPANNLLLVFTRENAP